MFLEKYSIFIRPLLQKLVMRGDTSLTELEKVAREELESLRGSSYEDSEWNELRSRLIEFALMLRSWSRNRHLQ